MMRDWTGIQWRDFRSETEGKNRGDRVTTLTKQSWIHSSFRIYLESRCNVIKKRVAVIKPNGNECCSNGFGNWKRNIVPNTAKVTNMIEAGAICKRNMFSEINITIKCNTRITYSVWWCDTMIKVGRRKETITFAALYGCTYYDKIRLLALSLSLLFFIQPEITMGHICIWVANIWKDSLTFM